MAYRKYLVVQMASDRRGKFHKKAVAHMTCRIMACSTGDRSDERDFNQMISHYNHNFSVVLSHTPHSGPHSLKHPGLAQRFNMRNFER